MFGFTRQNKVCYTLVENVNQRDVEYQPRANAEAGREDASRRALDDSWEEDARSAEGGGRASAADDGYGHANVATATTAANIMGHDLRFEGFRQCPVSDGGKKQRSG